MRFHIVNAVIPIESVVVPIENVLVRVLLGRQCLRRLLTGLLRLGLRLLAFRPKSHQTPTRRRALAVLVALEALALVGALV